MPRLYVGLSGYSYKEWHGEGLFYPKEVKQAGYFEYYVTRYNSVELDGTWYQMPAEKSVERWLAVAGAARPVDETGASRPSHFLFAPKMHRGVTHMARLKPESLDSVTFFLKRLKPMEDAGMLGPILVQIPPSLRRDDARLRAFWEAVPHRPTLRWAMEFRHESWHHTEVEDILREFGVAWVGQDTDEADAQRRHTAPGHIYIRLRKSDYPTDLLRKWADYFEERLAAGQNCFVYCKHEDAEAPWVWGDALKEMVK